MYFLALAGSVVNPEETIGSQFADGRTSQAQKVPGFIACCAMVSPLMVLVVVSTRVSFLSRTVVSWNLVDHLCAVATP
jgi:hypothetical protein